MKIQGASFVTHILFSFHLSISLKKDTRYQIFFYILTNSLPYTFLFEVLNLTDLKTSIEHVKGSKCNKHNVSKVHTNPEMTTEDVTIDSGSDCQVERDNLNSLDSEYDAKEEKKLCKKSNDLSGG